ncbi:MAG TPA: hypothetical protein VLJ39_03725 [Tepidisphaeraceae bacterium]|nr:hypothetical protein [Tepidisphaeraceae bacterium]
MSAPVVVLLICLPLMRPLRHPDPLMISDDELARLATIQAVVEHHTLEIQDTTIFRNLQRNFVGLRDIVRVNGREGRPRVYSEQSPMMSVLLSGPYWVMYRNGLSIERSPVLAEYLLTLFGVTLPIAFAAGLLYRMARMFELTRPYRAALALAVVVGSGWISYATVLSAGAAAAALVVMSAACLVQASLSKRRPAALVWVGIGGLCAALASTYELTALAFLVFLVLVIVALRWRRSARAGAIVAYVIGAALPIGVYVGLNRPITGDLRPGYLHPELSAFADAPRDTQEEDDDPPGVWHNAWRACERFLTAFIGGHGLLTHFPVLIFGAVGVSMVMHRHWPNTTKLMAAGTLLAGLAIVVGYTVQRPDWKDAMFANRWFLVFLPLTLFWAGAWLRRPHHVSTWVTAAFLWAFSAFIAILGATDPQPRQGYDRYTAAGAWMNLVQPPHPSVRGDMIAER